MYEYLTYKGIVYAFDIYVYAYAIDIGHFLAVKQNKWQSARQASNKHVQLRTKGIKSTAHSTTQKLLMQAHNSVGICREVMFCYEDIESTQRENMGS